MAVTAREVIMTFRGQNYLSGAIRRVGRDVGQLSRRQQFNLQQAQLQIVGQRLRQSHALAEAELASVKTGSRRIALDQARAQLTANEFNAHTKLRTIGESQLRNQSDMIKGQIRLDQLTRAAASGRPIGRGLARMTAPEVKRALEAQRIAQDSLLEQNVTLERQREAQLNTINNQSLAARQLAARESELFEREKQLTNIAHTRERAIDLNTLAQQRLNYETTRIEPVQRWQAQARAIEHAGRVLQMFGLIASATIGFAADQAAKLTTNLTLAATQARRPGAPIAQTASIARGLQQQTLGLMRQLPFTGQEFADAFYQVFSGTNIQKIGKATALIRTFGQAAIAGGTDLKTMVDAGITLKNVFGDEFTTATKAANAFFAAVRYGRMNAEQFAHALPNVASIAKQVGLSFYDIAGAVAALTRQTGGRLTQRDATGIARMIEVFARPEFVAGAKRAGVNIKDVHDNMRPLLDIITDISTKFKVKGVDAINLFKQISALGSTTGRGGTAGTIQARRAFAFLLNNLKEYINVSKLVRQDNNEMVASFRAMRETPGVQWALFINQVKVLVYEIGTRAIPAFIKLGRPLARLIKWFDGLSDSTQKWIAYALVIGSVGALVVGTVAAIAGGIASLIASFILIRRMKAFSALIAESGTAKGVLASLAGEAGFISTRLALGLGAPAAALALIFYHKQVGQAVNATIGMRNAVDLVGLALLAVPFLRFANGIRTITTTSEIAVAEIGTLKGALLGLGALGPISVSVLLSFLATKMPEIPAAGDALKLLRGQDPFAATSGRGQTPLSTRLSEQAQRGNDAFRKRLYDFNNVSSQAVRISRKYGAETPYEVIERFWAGDKAPAGKRVSVQQFNQFAEELLRADKGLAQKLLGRQVNRMDIISGVDPRTRRGDMRGAIAIQQNKIAAAQEAADRARRNRPGGDPVSTKNVRSVNQWITLVNRARQAMLGDPTDVNKARNYERLVDQLNKKFKDQPALLAAINDVLNSYDSDIKKTAKDAEILGVTFQDVLSRIQSMYDDFKQQETAAFGTLFQGPFVNAPPTQNRLQWGGILSGQDLVKDLRSQITQFKNFHGALNQLARRGAPPELLKQLQALGPEALKQIQALNKLSPNELQGYFKLFQSAQRIIHDQTMRDLRNQLAQYNRYGKNIALQIVAGLKSEQPALTTALTNLVKNMFPGLPVGETGAGGRPTHHAQAATITHKTEHHYHDETTIKVEAGVGPEWETKAQHALFRARNKYRH